MSEPNVRLDPEARARVARVALVALGIATTLTAALALVLHQRGRADLATSILVGHLLGQAITLTWVVGALWTFGGSHTAVMIGTIGAFPIRALVLVLGVGLAHQQGLQMSGIVFSMLATQVLGHVIEGYTFQALGDATRVEGGEPPAAPPPQES